MKEVTYTGNIPICPNCQKPTQRSEGMSTTTCMYFPPLYNEDGVNVNPDRNNITTEWQCHNCNKRFKTIGNAHDGYSYAF